MNQSNLLELAEREQDYQRMKASTFRDLSPTDKMARLVFRINAMNKYELDLLQEVIDARRKEL